MKFSILKSVFVVLLFALNTSCNEALRMCADMPAKVDFDLHKMKGVWNEIIMLPNQWEFGRCIRLIFSEVDDNGHVTVRWEQITEDSSVKYALSRAESINRTEASKLSLFFTEPYNPWPTPFWVIGTDYDNFALIYSCSQVYDRTTNSTVTNEYAWIMARKRDMAPWQKKLFQLYLSMHGIDAERLIEVNQFNCDEYDRQ